MNDETDSMGEAPAEYKKARRKKATMVDPSKVDRLPPHSVEAEQGVLGCILLSPADCLSECEARLLDAGHFYDLRHQQIYHAIVELFNASGAVDLITVQQWLKDRNALEGVGGLAYLACLPDAVPSAANLDYYLQIVREKFVLRRMIGTCVEVVSRAYEHTGEIDALLDAFQRDALVLTEGVTEQRAETLRQLMPAVIDELEDGYHRGSAQIKGLTTGLSYLDKILCGFGGKHGNFQVMAARPGVGKSAWAMQVAEHVAMDHKWFTAAPEQEQEQEQEQDGKPKWIEHRGLPVGVFSLEMSAEELLRRMLFRRSGVDAQRFKTGFASKQDFDRLGRASQELHKAPIYIDDDDTLTIEALTARARLMVRQHGIKLFVVDYIQCLKVGAKRFRPDRVQEMAEISSGLRSLGKTLGVPFIVLAQMNRDFAKEKGIRKPRLEDLRDCGAIEQDAHVVMFLYEDDSGGESAQEQFEAEVAQVFGTERKGDWSAMPRRMKILVAKNRHGMNNKDASVLFDGSCTRFYDYYDWKKQHGLKEPARGERSQEKEEML